MMDYAGNILGDYESITVLGKYTYKTASGELLNTEEVSTEMPVDSSISLEGDYQYLFVNNKGEIALDLSEYDSVRPFSEGLAIVERDGKFGYVDQSGEVVVPIKYSDAYDFKNGLAEIDGDYNYLAIDKEGNPVYDEKTPEEEPS